MYAYSVGMDCGTGGYGPKEAEYVCAEHGFTGDDYNNFWSGYYAGQDEEFEDEYCKV